jgi:hypothetical protein
MLEGLKNLASQAARFGVAATTAGVAATHVPGVTGKIVTGVLAGSKVGTMAASLVSTQVVGVIAPAVISAGWIFGEKTWDFTAKAISNYQGWKSQRDLPTDHCKAQAKFTTDKGWDLVGLVGTPKKISKGWYNVWPSPEASV